MKIKQLELLPYTQAGSIRAGECFLRSNTLFMRNKPTGYLLNSSLITDKLNARFILATNLEKGTMYFIEASEVVEPVETTLEWKKI